MNSFLRKIRTFLSVYYSLMTTYRAEIFLWAIATSLPLIMMGVWIEAGASGHFPMNEAELTRYFIAVFIVRQFSIVWVIHDFEYHVVTGRLSPLLLQPINPVWRFIAPHLSEQLARLPFVVCLVALLLWLYPQALSAQDGSEERWALVFNRIVLSGVMIYCAFALRFLMQYTLAMLAFWMERVTACDRLLMIPYLFLSGLIAPLEMFPENIRILATYTPFPYLVWFPASLLAGGDIQILKPLIVITVWLLVFQLLARTVWRRGLYKYSAMGT